MLEFEPQASARNRKKNSFFDNFKKYGGFLCGH